MQDPLIIVCATTGAEVGKTHNPNVPITPDEIIKSSIEAVKAGASQIHLHARDENGVPSNDYKVMNYIIQGIKKVVDPIIEVSTGGDISWSIEQRVDMLSKLDPKPELASLSMGSINFGNSVFANRYGDIIKILVILNKLKIWPQLEVLDFSWIDTIKRLTRENILKPPYLVGFGFNIPCGGLRYSHKRMVELVSELPDGTTWGAMAVGEQNIDCLRTCVAIDGHIRVGFEDNVFMRKGILAKSNAEFVSRAVNIAKSMEREIFTPDTLRKHYLDNGFVI